jgi:RND superfamily putative drug exporter
MSSRHPWTVVGVWIGLVVLSIVLIFVPGLNLSTSFDFLNKPESVKGFDLVDERFGLDNPPLETIVITSDNASVDDAEFQQVVGEVMQTLRSSPDLVATDPTLLYSYYEAKAAGSPAAEQLVSADRHTTLIPVTFSGSLDDSTPLVNSIDEMGNDNVQVMSVGDVSTSDVFNTVSEEDLQKAEGIAIPIALIILVLVLGALVAAGLPIVLAIMSIIVALGATALISQAIDLSFFITNMITMIGLAVGIDYALFIISRYREERGNGHDELTAIELTGGSASKAVLFSGVTVILALIGLFIIPTSIFQSLGLGAILVVIFAVLAMLTLIPALLALFGDHIDWPRKRNYAEISAHKPETDELGLTGGFWGWLTHLVMNHAVASVIITVTLLVAAAIPFFSLNTGFAGAETLPPSEAKQAYEILRDDFSVGRLAPVQIIVDATQSPEVDQQIQQLQSTLESNSLYVPGSFEVRWSPNNDLAYITVDMNIIGNSPEASDEIRRLRDDVVPQTFGSSADQVFVTGQTAFNTDFFDLVAKWTPIVFIFVLGLSFILLTIVFRSIVVPIKAIIMNLLSVGAAYGLMVLVFQKGYLHNILGFDKTPTIEAWIPIFLFCVLFGLSMDYHVFLLSRIREHYDLTHRNKESVAVGLQSTARIITGAALIMVVVFVGFATGRLVFLQQVGFGLAIAVLIDATVIRSVLVPASMAILGDRNWYFPKWLHWLPDVRVEGHAPESSVPASTKGVAAD